MKTVDNYDVLQVGVQKEEARRYEELLAAADLQAGPAESRLELGAVPTPALRRLSR